MPNTYYHTNSLLEMMKFGLGLVIIAKYNTNTVCTYCKLVTMSIVMNTMQIKCNYLVLFNKQC